MKKKSSSARSPKSTTEPKPISKRKVNPSKFPSDLPLKDLKDPFRPVIDLGNIELFVFPKETLSLAKTFRRGRTNLTLVRPTIVQLDEPTPYAGFDRRESQTRDPSVSLPVEPKA